MRLLWKITAMLSILGISRSLNFLCPLSSSFRYVAIGATTLYVVMVLMAQFVTNIRIYKEEEPPLHSVRTLFSIVFLIALYYFPYNYPADYMWLYTYSMFVFGFAIFQLNSPMDSGHSQMTLILGFCMSLIGQERGEFCNEKPDMCHLRTSLLLISVFCMTMSIAIKRDLGKDLVLEKVQDFDTINF